MRVRQCFILLMVVTLVTFLTPYLISQAVNFAQIHGTANDPTGVRAPDAITTSVMGIGLF